MQDFTPHTIQHGSKEFLVEHLVSADLTFMNDFLWSYRYFMKPSEVLNALIGKYFGLRTVSGSDNASQAAMARTKQLRVVNVLRKWVEQHFCDYERDDSLLCQLYSFLLDEVSKEKDIAKFVSVIVTVIQQKAALVLDEEEERKRLYQLADLMRDRDGGVKSSARSTTNSTKSPSQFSSAEIVIWLFDQEMVQSRDEAQKLCWQLFELGLLVSPASISSTAGGGGSGSGSSSAAVGGKDEKPGSPRGGHQEKFSAAISAMAVVGTNIIAAASNSGGGSGSSGAGGSGNGQALNAEAFADDNAFWVLMPPPRPAHRLPTPGDPSEPPFVLQLPLNILTQQLTLVEHRLFCAISPQYDLQSQQWTKSAEPNHLSAVLQLVQRTDKIALWVASEVLHGGKGGKFRRDALRRWIEVALACRQINNLGTTVGILAGIDYVRNVKSLWRGISTKTTHQLEELQSIFKGDQNYAQYRAVVKKVRGTPCMPYMGIFLRDLTFLEEASVLAPQPNVINFNKCRQIAAVFSEVSRLQESKYDFVPDYSLREYLTDGFSYVEEEEVVRLAAQVNQESTQ